MVYAKISVFPFFCVLGASTSESPTVHTNEAGFYDVAYSLVEIACAPAQSLIKFGSESGANAVSKEDNPVSRVSNNLQMTYPK